MNQLVEKGVLMLVRSAIRGELLNEEEKDLVSEELLPEITELAKKHDVNHLVAFGLYQNGLLKNRENSTKKEVIEAVCRYEQQNYELHRLCETLEVAAIDFMPLKGSVIRRYYPEPWMRTSCDIDILVHEEDSEKACALLTKQLGYFYEKKGPHDMQLFSESGVHLELHYTLIERGKLPAVDNALCDVWQTAAVCEGTQHRYEMADDLFYLYHMAHMAKHLECGGCGIRPFCDLWLLEDTAGANQGKRQEKLQQGGLAKFAEAARLLSRVWFDHAEHTMLTREMERYVLCGGVYGTFQNRIVFQQRKKGGRVRYLLFKVFLPYEVLKYGYPILQTHRWLTPVMEVRRWGRLLFCGRFKRTAYQVWYNGSISHTEAVKAQEFLQSLGLCN